MCKRVNVNIMQLDLIKTCFYKFTELNSHEARPLDASTRSKHEIAVLFLSNIKKFYRIITALLNRFFEAS